MRRSVLLVLGLCFVLFAFPQAVFGEGTEPAKAGAKEGKAPAKAKTKKKAPAQKGAQQAAPTPSGAAQSAVPAPSPAVQATPSAAAAASAPALPATAAPATSPKAPTPVPAASSSAPASAPAPATPPTAPSAPAPAPAPTPAAAKPALSVPALKPPTPPRPATPAKAAEEPSETYITPQSGTLVRERKELPRKLLYITPEISLGGQYANYKKLGKLAHFTFGAGLGLTLDEVWHIRFSVLNLHETHHYTDADQHPHAYSVWFVQPTVYAYYALLHLDRQASPVVPLDLFLGLKGGANVFRISTPMQGLKSQTDGLFGVAFLPRFYFWKRLGIAASFEVATTDYFKNYFIQYGATFFYDFEVIGGKSN